MATVTTGSGVYINSGALWAFTIVDFLRSNTNWTVAGSGNGSSGGMGTDAIASASDLTNVTGRWVVLENPSGKPQIMLSRYSTAEAYWLIEISPSGAFTGGNATTPATASDQAGAFQGITYAGCNMHITAEYNGDDLINSGFAACCVGLGSPNTIKGGMAFIPTEINISDSHPWVLFTSSSANGYTVAYLSDLTTTLITGCRGMMGETFTSTPALSLTGDGNTTFPNNMNNVGNTDILCPVIFGAPNTIENSVYKGTSTYMQWSGIFRDTLELFDSSTRISFGDVNFPWDGVSVPRI